MRQRRGDSWERGKGATDDAAGRCGGWFGPTNSPGPVGSAYAEEHRSFREQQVDRVEAKGVTGGRGVFPSDSDAKPVLPGFQIVSAKLQRT